jgi:hypothetical protein
METWKRIAIEIAASEPIDIDKLSSTTFMHIWRSLFLEFSSKSIGRSIETVQHLFVGYQFLCNANPKLALLISLQNYTENILLGLIAAIEELIELYPIRAIMSSLRRSFQVSLLLCLQSRPLCVSKLLAICTPDWIMDCTCLMTTSRKFTHDAEAISSSSGS